MELLQERDDSSQARACALVERDSAIKGMFVRKILWFKWSSVAVSNETKRAGECV